VLVNLTGYVPSLAKSPIVQEKVAARKPHGTYL
jgi:hypothetical protein